MGGNEDPASDNVVYLMAMTDSVPWYKKPNLRTLYLLLFPCVIGIEMTSGFDSQIINAAQLLPAWKEYFGNPDGAYAGIMASAMPLGSVFGLPFIPMINDKFGRRWTIMFGSIVMIIGTIIQGFAVNGAMYTVARGIIGFGLPFAIVAGSCLIGELGYAKERPILTSLFNASFYLGAVMAAGIAFGTSALTNEWGWRIPSLLQMAPSLLQVVFVLFLPESPRFLISKERYEEARAILVKYHAEGDEDSAFVVAEFAEIKTTIALERETSKASWMDLVRTAGMRRRLLIGSLLGLMTQLSGNVVISYFLGDVLKMIGYTDPAFQNKYNLGKESWNLICGILASLLVMRFKRRTMYLSGIISIFVVYVAWTTCASIAYETHSGIASKLVLFWIYAYGPAYSLCFNALTYTYLVEIFPFAQRTRGISVFQFFGKGAQFFSTNVNPIGTKAIQWKYFVVYCAWIFIEILLVYFLWPETSGRSLEELAFLFEEDAAHRTSAAVEKEIQHEEAEHGTRAP